MDRISTNKLLDEIRRISEVASDPEQAIDRFLGDELKTLSPAERLTILTEMTASLSADVPQLSGDIIDADGAVAKMVGLFLGKSVNTAEMNSAEVAEKFAATLKILFDSLNQIVAVMNSTLTGEDAALDTIRMIISSNMDQDRSGTSMQEYLDRIRNSFLLAHSSFQQAAKKVCTDILTDIDPEKLLEKSSALKFGPLRKAEQFEAFEAKFYRLQRWVESGGFMESLLREFEMTCRQAQNSR